MTETAPEWLYMVNDETGGSTRVPNDDGVQVWYEARGWAVTDPPEELPFVSVPDGGQPPGGGGYGSDVGGWVDLGHPDTGAVHRFPANPEALTGAHDAGWTALNRDGTVPKRQKPLDAALKAATDDSTPEPTQPEPAPDAAPEPSTDTEPATADTDDRAADTAGADTEGA